MYVADVMLIVYGALVTYSTHSNLSMMYNWGVLAGVMFAVQVASGCFLA
jgi:quinol-cytochrome oxidoreductase complex cytochrome b subunit